ncbi:HNH endonuclease [Blastococcus sp. SYSU D00922]
MTGWVDSLSADHLDNWKTCKEHGLWGTPSNAGGARVGDDLFLWKPLPDSGWLVHCRVTGVPRRVGPGDWVPWDDDRTYKYLVPIEVVSEPSGHIPFRAADAAPMAGLTHHVQISQFSRMTDEGVRTLSALFPRRSGIEQALEDFLAAAQIEPPADIDQRDYAQRLIAVRRGQRAFRQGLLEAFDRTCCVSGSQVEATLEAAHIRPFRDFGSHAPGNGLLLRADLHTLFDLRLLTVMPFGTVRVAPELRGSEYEEFDERQIRRAVNPTHAPSSNALAEHNKLCDWLQ